MDKLAISVAELAEVLGISKPKAYQIINIPDFPKVKLDGRILINKAKVQAWLDKHTPSLED